MMTIGEFATLADISIKTLRYYDEIDLLKPCYVDPNTGYRYYNYQQLARVNRLSTFKAMGLKLSEISELLDGQLTSGPIRRLLQTKRGELLEQAKLLQEQIAYLNNKIYEVEMDGRMSSYEVLVKHLEPMRVLALRGEAPLKQDVGATIAQLWFGLRGMMGLR